MKFRNKLNGEIRPAELREDGIYLYDKTTERWCKYALYLLAKYWEYYEEPKEYWYIDDDGRISDTTFLENDEYDQRRLALGNYFESEEEAERAVEKLKAYKRLKDKGFRFVDFDWKNGIIRFVESPIKVGEESDKFYEDLDLLFGGE